MHTRIRRRMCKRRRLNALDVKLHQRALELLEAKRAVLSGAGQLQALPPVTVSKEHRRHGKGDRAARAAANTG